MGVSMKLDPLGLTFTALLDEIQSPQAKSARLAAFAREKIDEAEAINRGALGRTVKHRTVVDGREGAPLDAVQPDGTIVATFDLVSETIRYVYELIRDNSPVRTGRYRDSHTFLADGAEADVENPPLDAGSYLFVSGVPYARKIERGLSSQAPNGVYQVTAEMAKRRFGNIALIRFTYASPTFGEIQHWSARTSMETPGRRGPKRTEWLTRNPAISIVVR